MLSISSGGSGDYLQIYVYLLLIIAYYYCWMFICVGNIIYANVSLLSMNLKLCFQINWYQLTPMTLNYMRAGVITTDMNAEKLNKL